MIVAQVSSIKLPWEFGLIILIPACTSVHLYLFPTQAQPRESRHLLTTPLVLAMANIHSIHRVPGRVHVRLVTFFDL